MNMSLCNSNRLTVKEIKRNKERKKREKKIDREILCRRQSEKAWDRERERLREK